MSKLKLKREAVYKWGFLAMFIVLFLAIFITQYTIPCSTAPLGSVDCEELASSVTMITLPTATLISTLNILITRSWEVSFSTVVFITLISGIIQYGAIGFVVGSFVAGFKKEQVKK